jgi:hypothetical protein
MKGFKVIPADTGRPFYHPVTIVENLYLWLLKSRSVTDRLATHVKGFLIRGNLHTGWVK